MTDDRRSDIDEQAVDYVLGTLDRDERAEIKRTLKHDAALKTEIDRWNQLLAPLAATLDAEAPPDRIWRSLEKSLDAAETNETLTVRVGEGTWIEIAPGVERKTLFADRETGWESFMLKVAPGATIPAHGHNRIEECLVLEGDFTMGELDFAAGDFLIARPGVKHQPATSATGGMLYIRGELGELYS